MVKLKGSLVNLEVGDIEISKGAQKLFDKVLRVLAPRRSVNAERAASEERLMKAENQITIARMWVEAQAEFQAIQERAELRTMSEQVRQQQNIEAVTVKAIPHLTEDAQPDKVDDDWLSHLLDNCRNVTDEQMQSVWSRILASEVNKPGSFSKRTLDLVRSLEKHEAELFRQICNRSIVDEDGRLIPIIADYHHATFAGSNLDFDSLSHLDSIGLIKYDAFSEYVENKRPETDVFRYGTKALHLRLSQRKLNEWHLNVGHVLFTQMGSELARICATETVPGFVEHLIHFWAYSGITEVEPTMPVPTFEARPVR